MPDWLFELEVRAQGEGGVFFILKGWGQGPGT